tara:strand:- start:838 stop:2265 length:1428 start_codon:yes stop_codon:yes gene_type:complete
MRSNKLKISTSSVPNSRLKVTVEVPAEKCKTSYEEALSRLAKTANLPGFRKGKVPKAVILQQIGRTRIVASALENLLQKSWEEALDKEKIEALCEPELKEGFEVILQKFSPEKSLSIIFETDIAPSPKLKATTGLKAETTKVEYDPSKVDELIEQSRKQLATIVPVENRPAKMGDVAVISFQGKYEDGTTIEGGSSESMDLELENGRMIPGFIEGIIGMEINQQKSLKCEFPEDYHQESSQGKKANFKVSLKDLKTRELPELDDAFAKQASDQNTMDELKNDLTKRLKEDSKREQIKNRQESLLNALVKELEVELPKTLIELESKNIVEQTARNFAQQGIDVKSMFTAELVQSLMESSRQEAEENLRKNFALNALSKQENIEVNQDELEEKMNEVRLELSKESNIDSKKLEQAVSDNLLQEKLLKWLEENNTVIEKDPNQKKTKKKSNSDQSKTIEKSKRNKTKTQKTNKPSNQS